VAAAVGDLGDHKAILDPPGDLTAILALETEAQLSAGISKIVRRVDVLTC